MKPKTAAFNVFFQVSEPLNSQIVKTSLEIRLKYPTKFWVDDQRYFPHFSIYLFSMPIKNKQKLIDSAKNFTQMVKPIEVIVEKIGLSQNGLSMVNFKKTPSIFKYHQKALEIFNPLREGTLRDKYLDKEYFQSLPSNDQKKLRKYGHRWVLDKYQPHITIASIEDLEIAKKVVKSCEKKFMGKRAQITALRITQEQKEPVDKSVLIFDQPIS